MLAFPGHLKANEYMIIQLSSYTDKANQKIATQMRQRKYTNHDVPLHQEKEPRTELLKQTWSFFEQYVLGFFEVSNFRCQTLEISIDGHEK
jgi:hypothetical protein